MWFECASQVSGKQCAFGCNNARSAKEHEEKTGHRVVFDSYDWTDE